MQPGKPIVGTDNVIFLNKATKQAMQEFRWINHDIFTEVDVYLVRNNKSKKLVTSVTASGVVFEKDSDGNDLKQIPERRKPVVPSNDPYVVRYYFTKAEHVDPFDKKYPVFKFRIEMVGNPSVFAETNDFKVVY